MAAPAVGDGLQRDPGAGPARPGEPGSSTVAAAPSVGRGDAPVRDDATGGPARRPDAARGPTPSDPSGGERASGRGFTATEIRIGVPMSRDEGAANNALGFEEDPGNPRHQLRIVIEEVNRTGGIAGRKVVSVIYEIDETSAQPFDQQLQAACSYWTEDEPVFAVAVAPKYTFMRDSFRACLEGRGVPLWVGGTNSNADADVFTRFPSYVEVASMNLSRMSRVLADDLVAQRFLGRTARLGLVRFDPPAYERAARQHFRPALARHGFEVAEEVVINEPQRLDDVGTVSAQIGSAVVRFKSRGVTHVVILEESSLLTTLFMTQAEGQAYRPRYGLHSGNGGQGLVQNVPQEQLQGAVGIGHDPVADVHPKGAPRPPGRDRCLDVMRRGGANLPNPDTQGGALLLCDTFFLLQASASGIPEPLRPEGLLSGLEAVGEGFRPASTFATAFSRRQRDGARVYRRVAFLPECGCFRYTGGRRIAS